MKKAILVIDVPDYLDEHDIPGLLCNVKVIQDDEYIFSRHFLKLKLLPNEIPHSEIDNPFDDNFEDEYEFWRIEGYNQCLKEILGETE